MPRPTRREKLETELNARLAKAEETIAATKTSAMSNVRGHRHSTPHRPLCERLIGTAPAGSAAQAAVAYALKR